MHLVLILHISKQLRGPKESYNKSEPRAKMGKDSIVLKFCRGITWDINVKG